MLVRVFDTMKAIFPSDGKVTPISLEKAAKFMIGTGAIEKAATWDQVATYDYLPR